MNKLSIAPLPSAIIPEGRWMESTAATAAQQMRQRTDERRNEREEGTNGVF